MIQDLIEIILNNTRHVEIDETGESFYQFDYESITQADPKLKGLEQVILDLQDFSIENYYVREAVINYLNYWLKEGRINYDMIEYYATDTVQDYDSLLKWCVYNSRWVDEALYSGDFSTLKDLLEHAQCNHNICVFSTIYEYLTKLE